MMNYIFITIFVLIAWFGLSINIGPIKFKMNGIEQSLSYWKESSSYRKKLKKVQKKIKESDSIEELQSALSEYPVEKTKNP